MLNKNLSQGRADRVPRRMLLIRACCLVVLGGFMYITSGGIPPRLWVLFLRTPADEGFIRVTLAIQLLCLVCAWLLWGLLIVSTGYALLLPVSSQQRPPEVPFWARTDGDTDDDDEEKEDEVIEEIRLPLTAIAPLVLSTNTGNEARQRVAPSPRPTTWEEEPVGDMAFFAMQAQQVVPLPQASDEEVVTAEVPITHSSQEQGKLTPQQRLEECYQRLLQEGKTPETITVTMLRTATRIKSETASIFLRNKRASSEQVAVAPLPSTPQAPSLHASSHTHEGRKRPNNEDSVLVLTVAHTKRGLFAVADGMGGHANGAKASRFTIEELNKAFTSTLATLDEEQASEKLVACVHDIHTRLLAQNADDVGTNQMGTTLTAALVLEQKVYIVNVGDSRTYWYSSLYDLTRITRDHSVVQQLIDKGELSENDRYTDTRRSHIYSCLGQEQDLTLDAFAATLNTGDLLLLCSDGLWEMVRDENIERTLATAEMQSLEEISQSLLTQALTNGGEDNVSVIVVQAA